jgi:hypothetical protein
LVRFFTKANGGILLGIHETPEGGSIDYPRLRAARTIKLNFLIDLPQEKFREVSEAEASKMKL